MLKTTRIAVLVSGGGTNLQALLDAQGRGGLSDGEIAVVISSKPGVYALERAGKAGAVYGAYHGVCLETQHFPDAVNHPEFPSQLLRRDEEYHHVITFTFK